MQFCRKARENRIPLSHDWNRRSICGVGTLRAQNLAQNLFNHWQCCRERIELIEALNQDCSSALAWLNMINHVKKHNSKASEASRRVRLFKRAQSLILETGTDAETLEVWLSYVYELHDLKDEVREIQSWYIWLLIWSSVLLFVPSIILFAPCHT